MKPFLKLSLLFLLSHVLIFAMFYWDQWGSTANNIGGGGYDLTYLYYVITVIIFLIFFNLFLVITTLYLRSKAREHTTPQSFLWISVPALILAMGAFLRLL